MVAVLGLLSAVVYGASDFLGGLASRRMTPLLVSLVAFVVAIVFVIVGVLVTGPEWSTDAVVLGAIAGVSGAIGQWAFFACLAIGPMSVLSPAVATIYAIAPAVVGILMGERFPAVGYLALVAVVVAAVLLAVPRERDGARVSPRALLLGLVAGLGFAGYIVAIDRTPPESGLVPILIDYIVSISIFAVAVSVRRARRGPAELQGLRDRGALGLAVVSGVCIAVANIMLVIALHLGDLAIVGVLNSLYPLGTVLLALAVLRERLSVLQGVGILLALASSAVLAVV